MHNNKCLIAITIAIAVLLMVVYFNKSPFNITLSGGSITDSQPKVFPPIDKAYPPDVAALAPPTVKEEIGLGIVYPQGVGVGMSKSDSNSFTPNKPGPLLTNYSIPESYGESSFIDPTGKNGADQGSRIIKLKSLGNQMGFKPFDEAEAGLYSSAYSDGEVQTGETLINGAKNINYSSSFDPEQNMKLQSSPGQNSRLSNCQTSYPNNEHVDGLCITDGDIPYGQIVNGKVNPRLVSRWQSYTGDYSREEALQGIDGLLFPTLNVLTNPN